MPHIARRRVGGCQGGSALPTRKAPAVRASLRLRRWERTFGARGRNSGGEQQGNVTRQGAGNAAVPVRGAGSQEITAPWLPWGLPQAEPGWGHPRSALPIPHAPWTPLNTGAPGGGSCLRVRKVRSKIRVNVLGSQKGSCLFPRVAKARLDMFYGEANRDQQ